MKKRNKKVISSFVLSAVMAVGMLGAIKGNLRNVYVAE